MYLIPLVNSKNDRGENRRDEMPRWLPCGTREECYVGYEDDTLKGFWARPARCSTNRVVFIYTVSPERKERKPGSYNWTTKLMPLRRKEGLRN